MTEAAYDILGTMPFTPIIVNPSSTYNFRFVLKSSLPSSLLVKVKDSVSGGSITGASVTLSKIGFSETKVTGRSLVKETSWSGVEYSSQDGGIDAESEPGALKLLMTPSSTYNISTESWLISKTIDLGGSSSTFYVLKWNPTIQPFQTSVKIQLSTNNNSSTWNFAGPDGTENTHYTVSSSTIWSGQNSNRYLRYKVFLSTLEENFTPRLEDLSVEFNSVCVPPYQVLFNNLSLGSYTLTASAPGYLGSPTPVSITGDWQQVEISLMPN
mgnify:FL=1